MLTLVGEKKKLIEGVEKEPINFIKRVMSAIDNNEWLYVPCVFDEEDSRLIVDDRYGKKYIAIYSSNESAKVAKDMILTDINKVIDSLFNDKNLSGLVIDLNDNPVYIERTEINLYSSRKDPRLVVRDWGKGIPLYKKDDLKTQEELHDFAMAILDNILEKQGYLIHERNNFSSWFVNYIVSKDNIIYFISVESGVAPKIPTLNKNKKEQLLIASKNHNAIPLFASVGFGSTDVQRFNKGLALCGDEFHARFTGFEEVIP